jgi:hypothetical protein
MPRLASETVSSGDMTWLDSGHGIRNAKTEVVDISAFTAGTHYPNGYIKSGTPVAKVGGMLVPYTSAEATTTGAGVLAGHILTDQIVEGTVDFPAPLLKHGRVKTAKVPQGTDAFTAPVAAAKRANVTIDYV